MDEPLVNLVKRALSREMLETYSQRVPLDECMEQRAHDALGMVYRDWVGVEQIMRVLYEDIIREGGPRSTAQLQAVRYFTDEVQPPYITIAQFSLTLPPALVESAFPEYLCGGNVNVSQGYGRCFPALHYQTFTETDAAYMVSEHGEYRERHGLK
jgi:hypothetical protein